MSKSPEKGRAFEDTLASSIELTVNLKNTIDERKITKLVPGPTAVQNTVQQIGGDENYNDKQ